MASIEHMNLWIKSNEKFVEYNAQHLKDEVVSTVETLVEEVEKAVVEAEPIDSTNDDTLNTESSVVDPTEEQDEKVSTESEE